MKKCAENIWIQTVAVKSLLGKVLFPQTKVPIFASTVMQTEDLMSILILTQGRKKKETNIT